jgi:hypothetical protein
MSVVIDIIKNNKKLSTEKNFIVDLEKQSPEEEAIEDEGKNIARLRVRLPSGEMVSGDDYIVEMTLTREARLVFGIELIRSAIEGPDRKSMASGETFYFMEMYNSTKGNIVPYLGVFLHPKSCQLLVCEDNFGTIEEEIEKVEKEDSAS